MVDRPEDEEKETPELYETDRDEEEPEAVTSYGRHRRKREDLNE